MTRIAVLADIHGNSWALRAVLEDLAGARVDAIINLGDTLWGPLDPGGVADLLMPLPVRHVRGNMDREMLDGSSRALSPTDVHSLNALTASRRAWLATHESPFAVEGALACHGTPTSDSTYLLEHVTDAGVRRRVGAEVGAVLGPLPPSISLVLCAHSHLPGVVQVPDGPLVVNPGSVGLPAYVHDVPCLHCMESGSPHARYALVRRDSQGWRVEHRAVVYDWNAAAEQAQLVARSSWPMPLRTGHAGSY